MKFTSVLSVFGLLKAVSAGPFSWYYYRSAHCGGLRFGCRDLDPFVCCEAPPSRYLYQTVKTYTTGPLGIPVFTYVDRFGNCDTCQFTGTISHCYDNTNPFNVGLVLLVPQGCVRSNALELAANNGGHKVPALAEKAHHPESKCRSTSPINHATVGGIDYTLNDEILDDFASDVDLLGEKEFSIKWMHLKDS
ncbi:hypothetical protein LMH87_001284 [Akanthomyces muscarius]|uniref:Uncharacterized protein n=1 Tax=Akanthomyces muscarius TaxID=2231603 RepID=A0A9W8QGS1_AKAMU|nr:hypothetical protein LMH87_001284 [Akanthomyces muscarius]KAJ4156070.1 hypothetical protein LMH87_001284 [Akanthomyces muscarius]